MAAKNLLESFEFKNETQMLYGKDSVEKLGATIKAHGITKVLLHFGGGSVKKNGLYDRVIKNLTENGISSVETWGVQPNPVITTVRTAVAICKNPSQGIQAVLAVGGGSVIDSAKAVCAGATYDGDTWDIYKDPKKMNGKHLPLYTVLTLSATATEFNGNTVVTNHEEGHVKVGPTLFRPTASSVDPTVQFSLPWRQVMAGAVDSLSHAMESFFSLPNQSYTTRKINLSIQRSIIQSANLVKINQTDYDARTNFCWAVGLALNGIQAVGLSGDWNVHQMQHALGGFNDNMIHGEGLAVISLQYYPYLYKNKPEIKDEFEEWAEALFGFTGEGAVEKAFAKFKELYIHWEAPLTLGAVDIKKEDIAAVIEIDEKHRTIYSMNSPLLPRTKEIYLDILNAAL